jgi:hypothetical protein
LEQPIQIFLKFSECDSFKQKHRFWLHPILDERIHEIMLVGVDSFQMYDLLKSLCALTMYEQEATGIR